MQKNLKSSTSNWHFTKILNTASESPAWPTLKASAKVVYFNLSKHYNFNYKISYPTNKDIMKEEGLSSATLESAFKELDRSFFIIRKNFLYLDRDPFLNNSKGQFFKNDKNYFYIPDFLLQDLNEQIQDVKNQTKSFSSQESINILVENIKSREYLKIKYHYLDSKYPYLVFDERCLNFDASSIQNLHINYIIKQYNKLIELFVQKISYKKPAEKHSINITNIHGDQVNVYKGDYQKKLNIYNLKLGNNKKLSENEIDSLLPRINRDIHLSEEEKESIKSGIRSGIIGWPSKKHTFVPIT